LLTPPLLLTVVVVSTCAAVFVDYVYVFVGFVLYLSK